MGKWREWIQDQELQQLAPPDLGLVSNIDYAVEADGRLIGFCHVFGLTPDQAELGIMIGEKTYWGKGCGTEAMRQLAALCFSKGLKRVYLKALSSNSRAIQCYKKCGFTRYGSLAKDGNSWILMELYNK